MIIDIYKETFQKLFEEELNEIKKSSDKINHVDLIYYFTGNTDEFNNGIELFKKIRSGETKLEEAKKSRTYLYQI